jgi:uncharacterized membrane protein
MMSEGGLMTNLIAAAALFLGIHLLVSGTKLRDLITARIGEKLYVPLFALAALGALVWLCIATNAASVSPANTVLFVPPAWVKSLGLVVIAAAFALVVPGVLRGNPTSAGQEKATIDGILRVTRHPFLMGVTLWSGFHLIAKGTLAATLFFATFLVLAIFGTRAIDGKVARRRPGEFKQIAAQTSIIPFVAIAEKRNRFMAPEVLDWRFSVAAALFGAFLYFHTALFGVAPFPAEWLAFLTGH